MIALHRHNGEQVRTSDAELSADTAVALVRQYLGDISGRSDLSTIVKRDRTGSVSSVTVMGVNTYTVSRPWSVQDILNHAG